MQFQLVSEHGRPIAALIPPGATGTEIRNIYSLLPPASLNSPLLAERWAQGIVASPIEWSERQLRRVPCLPPKPTLKLQFL